MKMEEKGNKSKGKVRFWWFDERQQTDDSEETVRQAMLNDGYIEGLEWGFIRHSETIERRNE